MSSSPGRSPESGPSDTPSSQGGGVPRPATAAVAANPRIGCCIPQCVLLVISLILLLICVNLAYIQIDENLNKRHTIYPVWVALLISFATAFLFMVFAKCCPIKTWMCLLLTLVLILADGALAYLMFTNRYPSDKATG